MNDAFTLPFSSRRLQEELSAIGLALFIWLAGSISTRTKTAQQAIYRDPRLGSRASTSTSASFWPKSNAIRRVRSRPRNAPFFHGNWLSVNLRISRTVQSARTFLRTDNVRSIHGRSDGQTLNNILIRNAKKGFIFKVELQRGWVWFAFWNNVISTIPGSTI